MKQEPKDIPLAPFSDLKMTVTKVLGTTKAESDRQLAEIQAANGQRRAAKKKP